MTVQNDIAEIKLRAERRIGEFSRELPKEQTSGLKIGNSPSPHDGKTGTKTSILKDAGMSSRELPTNEHKFNQYKSAASHDGEQQSDKISILIGGKE